MLVDIWAVINDMPCSLVDISISGAHVEVEEAEAPRIGDPVRLRFTLSGSAHNLPGVVIGAADDRVVSQLDIAFAGVQPDAIDALARAIDDLSTAAG